MHGETSTFYPKVVQKSESRIQSLRMLHPSNSPLSTSFPIQYLFETTQHFPQTHLFLYHLLVLLRSLKHPMTLSPYRLIRSFKILLKCHLLYGAVANFLQFNVFSGCFVSQFPLLCVSYNFILFSLLLGPL